MKEEEGRGRKRKEEEGRGRKRKEEKEEEGREGRGRKRKEEEGVASCTFVKIYLAGGKQLVSKHAHLVLLNMVDPQVTMGFNTESWSSMTCMIRASPWLRMLPNVASIFFAKVVIQCPQLALPVVSNAVACCPPKLFLRILPRGKCGGGRLHHGARAGSPQSLACYASLLG